MTAGNESLQYRMSSSDSRLYSPDRDLAHIFKSIMAMLAERLEEQTLPEIETLLEGKITMDDRGDAMHAMLVFMRDGIINDNPKSEMADELQACGWFNVKPEARAALLAYLGTIFLGASFQAIREATINNVGPLMNAKDVAKAGFDQIKKVVEMANNTPGSLTVDLAIVVDLLKNYGSSGGKFMTEEEAKLVIGSAVIAHKNKNPTP